MDPVVLVYYGAICALLSAFAPKIERRLLRFVVGAAIGIVAAAGLPFLRQALALPV